MLYALTKQLFRHVFPSRQEGGPVLKFFYLEDYPDLSGERFSFYSNENKLMGYRYFYGKGPYKGVIIFHHGMGAGHNAYMALLYHFAKHGYMVYAYDNACCGDSEGSKWWNFSSSLVDQANFFKWFETDPHQKGLKRYLIGHSWGGFTAQYGARYPVDKVIAVSGFYNIPNMLIASEPKLRFVKHLLKGTQRHYYGELGNVNTLDYLKQCDKPVLLVHGEHDDVSIYQNNFVEVKQVLEVNPNIHYLSLSNKAHQPYMTEEGQYYYRYLNDSGIALGKIKPIPEIDYKLLTALDESVLNKFYEFLDS